MSISTVKRVAVESIALATILSLLMNCAPHGEILPLDRLFWIGLSLLLYSALVTACYAVPAHLLLRKLGYTATAYYLVVGALGPSIAYTILYWLVEGVIWPGGMVEPLAYNIFVGVVIGWYFHRQAYTDRALKNHA
ncbi:MAG: hypothetical protein QF790_09685 [Gammaproteobacteria bacterium]|nr:hypothetical protein [Gammaproteobacteria bacterium]MDP6617421.1 hypothetical protein [Gammaproteobacteria bacterium]MDP7041253.1 hypothetical protein [Gammaproteobacteria bacterium]